MTTIVPKLVGTGGDYTSLSTGWADWESAKPSDSTTNRSNTVGALSSSSTIQLDVSASGTSNFYTGHPVLWNAQTRLITAYDGTTKIATVGAYRDPVTEVASNATWDTGTPNIGDSYVIDSCIWSGRSLNFTVTVSSLTVGGSTNSSTAYPEMTTAIGASFRDNAGVQSNALRYNASNGAAITSSANVTLTIQESFFRISNLQVEGTRLTYAGTPVSVSTGTDGVVIDSCIISYSGTSGSHSLAMNVGTGKSITVINTLIHNQRNSSSNSPAQCVGAGTFDFHNCTFIKSTDVAAAPAINVNSSPIITATNCAFFGISARTSAAPASITYTNCFDSLASPPSGVTQVTYDTSTGSGFVAIASSTASDFRIISTSAMKDAGITDASYASVDIARTARPQGSAYDVGCWELVVAAVTFIPPNFQTTWAVSRAATR